MAIIQLALAFGIGMLVGALVMATAAISGREAREEGRQVEIARLYRGLRALALRAVGDRPDAEEAAARLVCEVMAEVDAAGESVMHEEAINDD